jgi:hypothetical protein
MFVRKLLSIGLILTAGTVCCAVAANGEDPIVILKGTRGRETLYTYKPTLRDWNPDGDGDTKFIHDTKHNDMVWGDDPKKLSAWLLPRTSNVPGIVTWHFRAEPGYVLAKDMSVVVKAAIFDIQATPNSSSSYFRAEWSPDGTHWTTLYVMQGGRRQATTVEQPVELASVGYTGGTDLYVRFTAICDVGQTIWVVPAASTNPPTEVFCIMGSVRPLGDRRP